MTDLKFNCNYRTNIRNESKLVVHGPCEFTILGINTFGQVEVAIRTHKTTKIEKVKTELPKTKVNL